VPDDEFEPKPVRWIGSSRDGIAMPRHEIAR
jgi:hypothetical protein